MTCPTTATSVNSGARPRRFPDALDAAEVLARAVSGTPLVVVTDPGDAEAVLGHAQRAWALAETALGPGTGLLVRLGEDRWVEIGAGAGGLVEVSLLTGAMAAAECGRGDRPPGEP